VAAEAAQPREEQQHRAGLGHRERDGGQRRRVEVGAPRAGYADGAARIARRDQRDHPGGAHRQQRPAGTPPAEPAARQRDAQRERDRPRRHQGGGQEAVPEVRRRHDRGAGRDQRQRPVTPDQRGERPDRRRQGEERQQEPQWTDDEPRHRGDRRLGHAGQRGRRQRDCQHPDQRADRPGQRPHAARRGWSGIRPRGGPSRRGGRRVAARQEEQAEGLEEPGHRLEGRQGGQRAPVVQGPVVADRERRDQPVAEHHAADRECPYRVDPRVTPGGHRVTTRASAGSVAEPGEK